MRDLASRSGVPAPTLSRVIDLLDREALLVRDAKGGVSDVDWSGVIRRWSGDYGLRRSNNVTGFLEPRGLPALTERLETVEWPYAVTGSLAAQRFAPFAAAKVGTVYVTDAIGMAQRLGLRESETGVNVLLAEPFDTVVFDRTSVRGGLVVVAPTQLAADLLTGPGREPSEGEELLSWMESNEDAWRS